MLTSEINNEVIPAFSQERLLSYENLFSQVVPSHATSSNYRKIRFYLELQQIYAYFYVPMQILEVTLRNKVNREATVYYQQKFWLPKLRKDNDSPQNLKNKATAIMKQTNEEFQNKTIPLPPKPSDYIARITFGFWLTLLDKDFRTSKFLQIHGNKIFPNKGNNSLAYIYGKLLIVHNNRNRLYHYEPLWKISRKFKNIDEFCDYLIEQYDIVFEIIYFCSDVQKNILVNNRKHFIREVLKFKMSFHG